MKLAVADANIFIDLIYTKSTSYLFRLGYEIHTVADVIDELHKNQQAVLDQYRLKKALHEHLDVHGILWLFDRFFNEGLLTAEACAKKASPTDGLQCAVAERRVHKADL
jgi:hypothetical protein